MIDEAFMPFRQIVERLVSFRAEFVDEAAGVRSYIYSCELDLPVELDVTRDETGALLIGSTPPLYNVDTSVRPSVHRMAFTANADARDGD